MRLAKQGVWPERFGARRCCGGYCRCCARSQSRSQLSAPICRPTSTGVTRRRRRSMAAARVPPPRQVYGARAVPPPPVEVDDAPLISAPSTPLLPGSSTLPGHYGRPFDYYYQGAYYGGGPYPSYFFRLPYACGVYGYCEY